MVDIDNFARLVPLHVPTIYSKHFVLLNNFLALPRKIIHSTEIYIFQSPGTFDWSVEFILFHHCVSCADFWLFPSWDCRFALNL